MHYHTQHAPLGAFACFSLGLPGARGGFGQSLSRPANQNVYVGYRRVGATGAERWHLLPFCEKPEFDAAAAFTGQTQRTGAQEPTVLNPADVTRVLGWASDTWSHAGFSFQLFTPFSKTGDPATLSARAARLAFAPVITAEIAFDNQDGETDIELMFGCGTSDQTLRPLEDTAADLCGFALGPAHGFAARPRDIAWRMQALDLFHRPRLDESGLHRLGPEACVVFRVAAGEVRRFPLALGFYQGGLVTTGLPCRYYYTRWFDDLEAVLRHGLAQHATYRRTALQRDAELDAAPLTSDQHWLLAQATHSYQASTQLLVHQGQPLWVVNEGEYRMINTLDLTVDHLFFEATWYPWAVRNTLDWFARRYRYTDSLQQPGGARGRGGVSFTHDMGIHNQFSPAGRSSYECYGLKGCFSQMTMEQLLNWTCCATTYALKTGDLAWLRRNRPLLRECAESLRRRDDPTAAARTGLLKWDSSRCGPDGSEITTYDSLDKSLGQARNNSYIAVKAFATWTLLEKAFGALRLPTEAEAARAAADLAAQAIADHFDAEAGMFPAIFEPGNTSRILPIVEGLVFPLYLGFAPELRARYGQLFANLSLHLQHALQSGVCLDAESGAWKLSSTSHNTWLSKIVVAQYIVGALFPEALSPAAREAESVHTRLQQTATLGRFAIVDQFHSSTGADLGSRFYPRVVTSYLWLADTPTRPRRRQQIGR